MNLMEEESITEHLLQHAFNELHFLIKSFFDCLFLVLGYFCDYMESNMQGTKRKASEEDDDADVLMLYPDEDFDASTEIQEQVAPSAIKRRKRKVLQITATLRAATL